MKASLDDPRVHEAVLTLERDREELRRYLARRGAPVPAAGMPGSPRSAVFHWVLSSPLVRWAIAAIVTAIARKLPLKRLLLRGFDVAAAGQEQSARS